ncbi:MAG: hypothetical protein K0R47_615 [Brevibacillus sp.]|nr:hypothetical protein [Brevibacillus sp.]
MTPVQVSPNLERFLLFPPLRKAKQKAKAEEPLLILVSGLITSLPPASMLPPFPDSRDFWHAAEESPRHGRRDLH